VISMRQHAISIAAIFLALAIGVVLGSGMLSSGLLSGLRDDKADLQNEIERVENVIADRRELYNDQVFRFNTRIAQVPANLFAGLFGWKTRPFFLAEPLERATPNAGLDAG